MTITPKEIREYVEGVEEYRDLYNIWKIYSNKKPTSLASNLKILLISNPCNGFGDIIFGMKIYKYLLTWYKCYVKIATSDPQKFITLGFDENSLYVLRGKRGNQCRRLKLLSFYNFNDEPIIPEIFDLIFITPHQADFSVDLKDVATLIPYATKFNTYYFSEYNDELDKYHDFSTGIGESRLGMLLTKKPKNMKSPEENFPYTVVYLAESVDYAEQCFLSYIRMIVKKYGEENSKFKIFAPKWITKYISENTTKFVKIVRKFYNKVIIIERDELPKSILDNDGENILYIDSSIFPQPYEEMASLYAFSVSDILVTGDQSLTDVLSVCKDNTNVWYQIVPWKRDLSDQLSKIIPNKYLRNLKTSCGTIQAINYHMSAKKLVKDWNFEKLGRQEINRVINLTLDRENIHLLHYIDVVENNRKIEKVLKEYE
jgi:hypothetical protein